MRDKQNEEGIQVGNHCISYLDKGYVSMSHSRAAFHNDNILVWQLVENTKMKHLRGVGAEMPFGKVLSNSKLLSHWRGRKNQRRAVGSSKLYLVCALIMNIHTCIYGSTVSEYFEERGIINIPI